LPGRLDGDRLADMADETAPPSRLLGAHHTGFTVSDLERSITFYRDQLGMVLISRQEGSRDYLSTITGFPGVYLKQAFLRATPDSDHILELLEYVSHPDEPTPRETNRPGNGHLCLRVSDIEGIYRDLSAQGITFISPPCPVTSGINTGVMACYLRDPDGFTIELHQRPPDR
jgi:catechol 2,3-dioxygenase-like lactoylglutathione lyase family enzyme